MSEVAHVERAASSSAADSHLSARRQALNEKLYGWVKTSIAGGIIGAAGAITFPIAPPVGALLLGVGAGVEAIGGLGILGNVLKRIKKSNR